jgi:hypothetical protein
MPHLFLLSERMMYYVYVLVEDETKKPILALPKIYANELSSIRKVKEQGLLKTVIGSLHITRHLQANKMPVLESDDLSVKVMAKDNYTNEYRKALLVGNRCGTRALEDYQVDRPGV